MDVHLLDGEIDCGRKRHVMIVVSTGVFLLALGGNMAIAPSSTQIRGRLERHHPGGMPAGSRRSLAPHVFAMYYIAPFPLSALGCRLHD